MEIEQNRFKQLRKQLGLSQAEIAEMLGMHQTAWGRFETGKVPDPRVSTIVHICKTFSVSADWLLGLNDTAYRPSSAQSSEFGPGANGIQR